MNSMFAIGWETVSNICMFDAFAARSSTFVETNTCDTFAIKPYPPSTKVKRTIPVCVSILVTLNKADLPLPSVTVNVSPTAKFSPPVITSALDNEPRILGMFAVTGSEATVAISPALKVPSTALRYATLTILLFTFLLTMFSTKPVAPVVLPVICLPSKFSSSVVFESSTYTDFTHCPSDNLKTSSLG